MCGICGYISKKEIADSVIDKMVDVLVHRGPDDRGVFRGVSHNNEKVCLGHRRLSIIDCSDAGHQPMTDSSGRYVIVFNGEIYNFKELKNNLSEYNYSSTSDTEVLLNAYIKYGTDCLAYLNGMFAFAIYDKVEESIFMARDRMGEKPLYYYNNGEDFVFASELKSIREYPFFENEINKDVLVQYFSQSCILPPNTIYKNTYKLSAGESLFWKKGSIEKKRYYSPIESYFSGQNEIEYDYNTCKKTIKNLLYDSIEKRMISDVPLGTFLSGGIDSTLVTAIAADIRADRKIDTFSIGFNDKKYDESSYARQSADYLGTRHHEKIMSEEDLFDMLSDMTTYYDEPFSDSSQLPTMLVSKFAREYVTVVLSGDGGDELFAGYSNNDTLIKLRKYDAILSSIRSIIPEFFSNLSTKDSSKILFEKKNGLEKVQYYAKIRENLAKNILVNDNANGLIVNSDLDKVDDWLQKRMLIDMTSYLPDEIMTKTDRASMRFSLEMRCPVLDHRIVDYSMRIPLKYKYKDGIKKYILKDILYDYIPKEMMDRPKKGFGVPIRKWLMSNLSDNLKRYLDKEYIDAQGIFDSKALNDLYRSFIRDEQNSTTQMMWSYYVFQMWLEKYCKEYSNR